MDTVFSGTLLLAFIQDIISLGKLLNGSIMRLVTDATPIGPTTALSSLTTANYDGYADSAPAVWGTPHLDSEGRAVVECFPQEFRATGGVTHNSVTQVVLMDSGKTEILASYVLPAPLAFNSDQSVYQIGMPIYLSQPSGGQPGYEG